MSMIKFAASRSIFSVLIRPLLKLKPMKSQHNVSISSVTTFICERRSFLLFNRAIR